MSEQHSIYAKRLRDEGAPEMGPTLAEQFLAWLRDPGRRLADDAFGPGILRDMANAVQQSGLLLITVSSLGRELSELRASANAIMDGLEWDGDGYTWNPKHGHYVERPRDAVARGAAEYRKQRERLRAACVAAMPEIACLLQQGHGKRIKDLSPEQSVRRAYDLCESAVKESEPT